MRGIRARDIREFQKRMEEQNVYLGVEEAHDILYIADDIPDAEDIACRGEYESFDRICREKMLEHIWVLEDKVTELSAKLETKDSD